MFCIWTEPLFATSYGDDHHHCWDVTVFLRLISTELYTLNPSRSTPETLSHRREATVRSRPSNSPTALASSQFGAAAYICHPMLPCQAVWTSQLS